MEYKQAKIQITNATGHEYSVDTNGRVVNDTTGHVLKGRLKNGYHLVCINQTYHSVHRFVAMAFCENPDNKSFVNHKDGIKNNNRAENLEWVTHRENMTHARDTGLWVPSIGVEHGRCKTTETEVHKVCKMLYEGLNWRTIKHRTNMTRNTFLNIRRRKTWKHISSQYDF